MIKIKNKVQRKFRKSRTEKDKLKLYGLINKIKVEVNEIRQKSWTTFIKSLGPSPLSTIPFWRRIKRLKNKKTAKTIGTLEKDGILFETNKDKAQLFSERLEKAFSDEHDPLFDAAFLKKRLKNILKSLKIMMSNNDYASQEKK